MDQGTRPGLGLHPSEPGAGDFYVPLVLLAEQGATIGPWFAPVHGHRDGLGGRSQRIFRCEILWEWTRAATAPFGSRTKAK